MKYEAKEQLKYTSFNKTSLKQTKEIRIKFNALKEGKQIQLSPEEAKPLLGKDLIQAVKEGSKEEGDK